MLQTMPSQTVFGLIKMIAEANSSQDSVLPIVRDLAAAALEHDDAYVDYYLAGGTLTWAEWKGLWQQLAELDRLAYLPGWQSTPEYERQVAVLEYQLGASPPPR